MTETTSMSMSTEGNDRQANNQPKKKKTEDAPLPADLGLKPVQLQRRRVWRACESCRSAYSYPWCTSWINPLSPSTDGRRSSAMASNRAHTALYTATVSEFLFVLSRSPPLTFPTIQSVRMTSLPIEGGTLLLSTLRPSRTSWRAQRQPCASLSRTST